MAPRHVLLVENNDADALLISDALVATGVDLAVHRVPDGVTALAVLEAESAHFDLVLLDLRMHRLSGEDVLRRVSHRRGPPIVVLTGSSDPSDAARGRELGADDFQTKPALPDEYRSLARSLCARWFTIPPVPVSIVGRERSDPTTLEAVRALLHGAESVMAEDVLECFLSDDGEALATRHGAKVSAEGSDLHRWLARLDSVRTTALAAPPLEDTALRAWAAGLGALDTRTSTLVRASIAGYLAERARSERLLAERLVTAVERCPIGLLMVDDQGRIVLVNHEIEQMFGYARDELIGQRVELLVPAAQRVRHVTLRANYQSQHGKSRLMGSGRDLGGLRKDGTRFPVEVGLRPVDTDDGRFTVATVIDIIERTELHALLAERTAELRRSNEDLRQFASVVSHDLREPLRAVSNFTTLLKVRYGEQLDTDANQYLDYARDGAMRARQLMNDLLDYARLGRAGRPPAPVSIAESMERVKDSLGVAIHASGAQITCDERPVVFGFEALIDRLFHNLVDNAIKFRRAEPPHIRIDATREGAFYTIRCADNGIGIASAWTTSVFDVFRRLHTQAEYPGTGMGLAIAKRVVDRHGGAIRVESDGATGSTFVFTLPAIPDDIAPPAD